MAFRQRKEAKGGTGARGSNSSGGNIKQWTQAERSSGAKRRVAADDDEEDLPFMQPSDTTAKEGNTPPTTTGTTVQERIGLTGGLKKIECLETASRTPTGPPLQAGLQRPQPKRQAPVVVTDGSEDGEEEEEALPRLDPTALLSGTHHSSASSALVGSSAPTVPPLAQPPPQDESSDEDDDEEEEEEEEIQIGYVSKGERKVTIGGQSSAEVAVQKQREAVVAAGQQAQLMIQSTKGVTDLDQVEGIERIDDRDYPNDTAEYEKFLRRKADREARRAQVGS